MSSSRPVVLVVVVVVVFGLMIELLRRRQLREKYAAIWLIVSAMLLFFAIQPTLFARISHFLGFGLPVNLAFASAVVAAASAVRESLILFRNAFSSLRRT